MTRSSSGIELASQPFSATKRLDTLMAVGGMGSSSAMHCPIVQAFLKSQSARVRRLCSVCSGAFLLAAAGLLEGRRAVTHWRRAEEFGRLFPGIRVVPNAIYLRDGNIWTSAGISAGIDLALALIAEDLGEAPARHVAQEMVVYYHRPGGQSQFSALVELGGGEGRFAALLGWIRDNLGARFNVEVLAGQAGMSPRHFSRAFSRAVGMSPAKAVERLRLEAARERVEGSTQPIEEIAVATGFHDSERMRRAFLRAFRHPPQAMRRMALREVSFR